MDIFSALHNATLYSALNFGVANSSESPARHLEDRSAHTSYLWFGRVQLITAAFNPTEHLILVDKAMFGQGKRGEEEQNEVDEVVFQVVQLLPKT